MESLRKYIDLENSIDLGTVDTKKEPPEHIKEIFSTLKEEIETKVHEMTGYKRGYEVKQKKEVLLYLAGGALSELFIPGYKGKPKDYNFFIVNERYVETVKESGITVYGNMRDIVTDAFAKDIKYGTIKMEKFINNEKIKISINFIQDNIKIFDLAFRGFYYKGGTILASVKAMRDIENNQISINSLDTPLETYYRLKEFEERYGMTAAPVEKYVLLKFLERKSTTIDPHHNIKGKLKYYTQKREEEYKKEIENNFLERDIYSYLLNETLNDENSYKPEILEKARIMYEQELTEVELTEPFEIVIPRWDFSEEIDPQLYDEVKHKMAEIIKKYNVKNKLEELYSGPKRVDYSQSIWLKGEITNELIKELKDAIIADTMIKKSENTRTYYERVIETLRFKLFLDKDFLPEQKIISTEKNESQNFGNRENALMIEETRKINLTVKPENLYSKGYVNTSNQDKNTFESEECITFYGRGILIKYLHSGRFLYYHNNGLLNKKRKKVIERELKIFIKEWKKNKK
jgi:hypothetical protein